MIPGLVAPVDLAQPASAHRAYDDRDRTGHPLSEVRMPAEVRTPAFATAAYAVRVAGTAALLLGIVRWVAPDLSSSVGTIHVIAGAILAAGLAVLSAMSARGGSPVLPVAGLAWAVLVPTLGLTQADLLAGGLHVVVQVAHLVMGLGAIALGEALILRIIRRERRLRNTR
jgi:hypothetical protein